jgi:hypothetical protein
MSVLLRAARGLAAESVPRVARALRIPGAAWPTGAAAMGAMPAAPAMGAAWPSLRTPLAVRAAGSPERVAVRFALAVTALAESALPRAMRAAALSVAERLAVALAMPGRRGAVHGEFRDRPRRRVALDAGQRGADEAAVQADLGVGRRRLVLGSVRWRGLFVRARLGRRGRHGWRGRLPRGGRFIAGGRERHRLACRSERRRTCHGLLPAADRRLPALVHVFTVAGRAPDLADVVTDKRHDGVVAQPPLARTVVIDEITNPKLARMHAQSLENANPGAYLG